MSTYTLSIVLPCYNPSQGWESNVLEEYRLLKAALPSEQIQLIVVNDGSTINVSQESTSLFATESTVFIQRDVNYGKGFTLREGVQKAFADKIIYTDIDFPYTHNSFLAVYNALKQADVAIGVRSEAYYANMPKARVYISKTLRFFIRKFLSIPTDDTQCGLKGFNTKGKEVFLQTKINRYLFDLEFVFLSARQSLSIAQVPVALKSGIVLSKMRGFILLGEGVNFLRILFSSFFSSSNS
jgi:glycosyltransferase involved in cell wall biosynthesis